MAYKYRQISLTRKESAEKFISPLLNKAPAERPPVPSRRKEMRVMYYRRRARRRILTLCPMPMPKQIQARPPTT